MLAREHGFSGTLPLYPHIQTQECHQQLPLDLARLCALSFEIFQELKICDPV